MERLHDVLPQKRGRLIRLTEWFTPAAEMQTLPANPRAIRPVPPYDPRRLTIGGDAGDRGDPGDREPIGRSSDLWLRFHQMPDHRITRFVQWFSWSPRTRRST